MDRGLLTADPVIEEFRNKIVTADSPIHLYPLGMDAAKVTWAHAVNSQAKLTQTLQDDAIMMLEADVLLRGQGTPDQITIPVMAHPPDIDSDITLEHWLDKVILTNKGIKLDFKSLDALKPALWLLNARKLKLHQSIWLNADVLKGPNSVGEPLDAVTFLETINSTFPEVTISLGWKTHWSNSDRDEGYSEMMVQEMHQLCQPLRQSITFPVRAAAVRRSWRHLQWLLNQSRRYTLTIWTSPQNTVHRDDMNYVRQHSEHSRMYFDLPADLMPNV